ncbi:hypothetical protein GOP47_0014103 [Adiantum capillus-veneris]|uniref:C2 domain-containing protein n=1 Tax=Adiantum capillus-veneris TaxID=13818 RepID=A0A9D4UQ90_ADICA|nr:hypothetical protein GOP47_0014103 [Adiantum capillus-veneris]
MEHQKVELAILCADNLKDVRHLARMQTYANAWVDPNAKCTTDVDRLNGPNPVWNGKFAMLIPTTTQSTSCLTIEIYTNSFTGTKLVGRTRIPLLDILQPNKNGSIKKQGNAYYANYPIDIQGTLYISYCLMGKVMVAQAELQNQQANPYISTRAMRREKPENCIARMCTSFASVSLKHATQLPHPITPPPLQHSARSTSCAC